VEATSALTQQIINTTLKPIAPQFLDYKKDLNFGKVGIADIISVKNTENSIFRLSYRFDMGAYNYKLLPYAAQYLAFLGTDKYTAEQISKQFYNIACNYSMNVGNEVVTIDISGLQENFDKAVNLVEHVFANCKANEDALAALKSSILKGRQNNKTNKSSILKGLVSYAIYGAVNPNNNVLSNEEVNNISSKELLYILHNINNYKHTVTYYGPKSITDFTTDITKMHPLPKEFTPAAPAAKFTYASTTANEVLFADYDMVQSEINWVRNDGLYASENAANVELFNSYFGGGMGSIVFQTLRESKALAYSTYAYYSTPDKKEKENAIVAYIGSQADKMNEAVAGMNELLTTLPKIDKAFDASKGNALNSIESSRITKDGIIGSYFADKKLGFDVDSRIDKYAKLKTLTFDDVKAFHSTHLAGKPYKYCIVASEKKVKLEDMQKFGPVTKLSLEQIFGY
jgi:predicted Zn-dependent peptidase